ncbi:WD40 repeat domain-containing protein [Endozoicomonas acroporae]|uniref:WD40 repeat domain-containing protein n=1 Tax=Endozoicomonas acroporae TaxID=1701104 RepID=UPI003D7BF6F3
MPTGNTIGSTNSYPPPAATTTLPVEHTTSNRITAATNPRPLLLLDLPEQPIRHILVFLGDRDIKAMAQTCSSLLAIVRAEHLPARIWFKQFEPRQQQQFIQIAKNTSNHELKAWLGQFTGSETLISTICGHSAGEVTNNDIPPREPQKGKYFPQILFYTVSQLMVNCRTFQPELAISIDCIPFTAASATLSNDGRFMATNSYARCGRDYGRTEITARPAEIAIAHEDRVRRITFSTDNRHILSYTASTAKITSCNADGSWTEKLIIISDRFISSATFSPDSRHAVMARSGRRAIICTMNQAGRWVVTTTMRHKGRILSATFSPDSRLIVTTSDDHTVKIHGRDSNGNWLELTTLTLNGKVTAAEFSPDGKHIITISDDNNKPDRTATIFSNTDNGWVKKTSINHSQEITDTSFSPDSRHAVTESFDYTARILSFDTRDNWQEKTTINHKRQINSTSFSPDSHYLVTASNDHTAKIYRYDAHARHWSRQQIIAHDDIYITSATFSADGRHILTFSRNYSPISLPVCRARIHTRTVGGDWITSRNFTTAGGVYSAQFNHDGSHIVIEARNDNAIIIYGLTADGTWLHKSTLHRQYKLDSVTFSANGGHLMTISNDGQLVQVWHLYKEDTALHYQCPVNELAPPPNKKARKSAPKVHR